MDKMKCCIKHIKGSYILWDTKDQNPLIQIELLLTETLRALSLHTRVFTRCIQNCLSLHNFLMKSGTSIMSFFLLFIEEGEEELIKEVGENI